MDPPPCNSGMIGMQGVPNIVTTSLNVTITTKSTQPKPLPAAKALQLALANDRNGFCSQLSFLLNEKVEQQPREAQGHGTGMYRV